MARNLFILIFCATITVLLGLGCYESLRSGELTLKGRTSRRDREPIGYWFGMLVGTLVFLIMASGTALMAFVVCMNLFRR